MRITNNSNRGHQNTNLAKCSKMTEGEHRIHGMNGANESGPNVVAPEEGPQNSEPLNLGGRLKFFKNGRFILELARAREGEKVAWVPVPKKTFWPPQGSASSVSSAYRQESSTSLSVSDDNSSVQSSPWQRDHTWKQSSPQRNAAANLTFFFAGRRNRPKTTTPEFSCYRYHLQRSPYASSKPERTQCTNNKCNSCIINKKSSAIPRQSLNQMVQVLWNKSLQLNNITSPRKRILRDLERVTIDDLSVNKRCRGKIPPLKTIIANNNETATATVKAEQMVSSCGGVEINGGSSEEKHHAGSVTSQTPVINNSAKNCSYSITSLLGGKVEDRRDDRMSSQFISAAPSRVNTTHHRSYVKDEIEDRYGQHDTVDSPLRNTDLMPNKRSPLTVTTSSPSLPNSPADHHYQPPNHSTPTSHHNYPTQPPPYVTPYAVYPSLHHHPHAGYITTPYYSPAAAAAAAAAAYATRGTPSGGYYHPHHLATHSPAISHHTVGRHLPADHQSPYSPPSWHSTAPSAVVTPTPAGYERILHRDDTISDVPLNLSKHAD